MLPRRDNFRYLNRDNRWLDFHWSGIGRTADGALELLSSPELRDRPPDLSGLTVPAAPSGVAVDASGRTFYSVPAENRIYWDGGCSPDPTQLSCLVERFGLAPLNAPRGLWILNGHQRGGPQRLVVVDSGNHRLLFFDLASFELRDVWGQDDVASSPLPHDSPGHFCEPWTVSADGDGNLYVLDYGNRRIQKFRRTAEPDLQFADRIQYANLIPHPGALAVSGRGAGVNIFVFDIDAHAIFVFDASGAPLRGPSGEPVCIRHRGMAQVLALAAADGAVYAGDNGLRRVLSFHRSPGFPFSGEAAGFDGPVAAMAVDPMGALIVSTGGNLQPLHLQASASYLPVGVLWSDAISGGQLPVAWNRLRASVRRAPGARIVFYYSLSNSPTAIPVVPADPDPFSDPRWIQLPGDVTDFLLSGDKARYLFVGAIFRSDRSGTPALTQMRADFNDTGYLPYLPVIYRQPPSDADFLRRFLALFQGIFEDIEGEVESLVRYFNPQVAPAEAIPWLAGWLALELDQGEPLAQIRSNIRRAFHRYSWRGTAEGLQLALLEDAGVHAHIVQPIANASFWAFPGVAGCSGASSTPTGVQLGAATTLAGAEPGGAVLGSTAHLDHSYLIGDAQFGEPLFEQFAYQFVVEVYRSEVDSPARLALVHEIVERERPAHTVWRLAILEPAMRVGFQARAGIDTIVAGTPGPSGLGGPAAGGLRLAGEPPPRVGTSRIGEDLKLEQ